MKGFFIRFLACVLVLGAVSSSAEGRPRWFAPSAASYEKYGRVVITNPWTGRLSALFFEIEDADRAWESSGWFFVQDEDENNRVLIKRGDGPVYMVSVIDSKGTVFLDVGEMKPCQDGDRVGPSLIVWNAGVDWLDKTVKAKPAEVAMACRRLMPRASKTPKTP